MGKNKEHDLSIPRPGTLRPGDSVSRRLVDPGVAGNGVNVPLGDVPPIVSSDSSGNPASDLSRQGEDDQSVGYPVLA